MFIQASENSLLKHIFEFTKAAEEYDVRVSVTYEKIMISRNIRFGQKLSCVTGIGILAVKMKYLRTMKGCKSSDRMRNEDVRNDLYIFLNRQIITLNYKKSEDQFAKKRQCPH